MIPPEALQHLVEQICHTSGAHGTVLALFHEEHGAEIVVAQRKDMEFPMSVAEMFRRLAKDADDTSDIDSMASALGPYKPGDVFQVALDFPEPMWTGALVMADVIEAWGVSASAKNMGPRKETCFRHFKWNELHYVGRARTEHPDPVEDEKRRTRKTK